MNNFIQKILPEEFDEAKHDAVSDCPVNALARSTLVSARSLARMLRALRISMNSCSTCQNKGTCPLLADFNNQLTIALQEIADEWRLG